MAYFMALHFFLEWMTQFAVSENFGENLFSLYDPSDSEAIFQIDGNLGYSAAVMVSVWLIAKWLSHHDPVKNKERNNTSTWRANSCDASDHHAPSRSSKTMGCWVYQRCACAGRCQHRSLLEWRETKTSLLFGRCPYNFEAGESGLRGQGAPFFHNLARLEGGYHRFMKNRMFIILS